MSLTTEPARAEFGYDPFSAEVMADPLPFYRHLREHQPIYYMPEYDMFALSRFDDVLEMLSVTDGTFVPTDGTLPDPGALRRHNNGKVVAPTTAEPLPPYSMFGPPVHEILRQAHVGPLRAGAVRKLADFIREQANERLDLLLPRGRFDLTQHYGGIVAAAVQCHLFRIPLSEAKYLLDTVNAGSLTDEDPQSERSLNRYRPLVELVEGIVRQRRKQGADGSFPLVDGLLTLELDGRKLTNTEIAQTLIVVIIGGSETVPKVVAHGLWELQKNPDQMAAVRADLKANVPIAFKEMVRLCGPAQWFARTVQRPTSIGGQEMNTGQRVIFLIPSAARDEREYGPDSESFRWNREIKRWVNFAWGNQFCTGYHLALLEGGILVEEFLRRVPDFEVQEADAVRLPSFFQWGWNELPVTVPVED
jgi:cytochrome P450